MAELAEVPESEAGPDLQPIYADIKATAGTAMVNLIYRHIATIPSALPWVWMTIKSGIGYEQINVAVSGLEVSGFGQPLSSAAFHLLGLSDADVQMAARIVAGYNSANALNIVTLAALRRIIDQVEDGPVVDLTPMASPAPPGPRAGGRLAADCPDIRNGSTYRRPRAPTVNYREHRARG